MVQERHQLWWTDVPFEGDTGSKIRPVLLLRKTLLEFNGQRDLYWKAAYVTSKRPRSPFVCCFQIDDWDLIGLNYPSWVYPTEEIPVLPSQLIDYIGKLSINDIIGIKNLLRPVTF